MTSEPFEVSDDQDSVQMLTRNSQVGEFYVLQPPQVTPEKGKEKFTCDALIYDEESDRHVRVTWAQALKACCIGGQGNISADTDMSHPTGGMGASKKLSAWMKEAIKIQAFNEQKTVPENTYPGQTEAVAPPENGAFDQDIRIVVARPFIEYAPRPAQSHSFDNALTVLPWCARAGT